MHKNKHSVPVPYLRLVTGAGALFGLFGCAGEAPGADPAGEPAAELAQPISGGTLVQNSENTDPSQPFGPVVRINASCTATQISSTRFITAAHCLSRTATSVSITNATDGISNPITRTITRILRHPSWILASDFSTQQVNQGVFDLMLFDVSQAAPYPVLEQPSGQVLSSGIGNLLLVGYGCDLLNPGNEPKKQKATFTLGSAVNDMINTHYLAEASPANSCNGDSGGPLLRFLFNQWNIVGVVSGAPYFTRVGSVAEWIADPVVNVFTDQSSGYFMNALVVGNTPAREVHCASIGANNDVNLNYCDTPNGTFTTNSAPNAPGWRLLNSSISGTFKIVSRANGMCMTRIVDGNIRNAVAQPCVADTAAINSRYNQSWTFSDAGVAPTATVGTGAPTIHAVTVINQRANECLSSTSGSVGADVRLTPCDGSTGQKWVFTR